MPADLKVVKQIKGLLDATPTRTVESIAVELGMPQNEVSEILDEWRVDASGDVTCLGPGMGGGWVG